MIMNTVQYPVWTGSKSSATNANLCSRPCREFWEDRMIPLRRGVFLDDVLGNDYEIKVELLQSDICSS